MSIIDYGFTPAMMPKNENGTPARVISVHMGLYGLVCEHGEVRGVLKPGVYFRNKEENIPVVGDFVLINYNPHGESLITKTLERKSFLSRRDSSSGRGEQAVAANFDYVFIMMSLNADFNIRKLERYLSFAWQSGGIPVVILNKVDLAGDWAAMIRAAEKSASNVAVHAMSVKTGYGTYALGEYLKPGKTIVLLGPSGAGKSSLVNAMAGKEIMAVNEIRKAESKGCHTTTHYQLILLESGAMIIDTPGMSEVGMRDVSNSVGEAFSDVERWLGLCRFSNCRHQTEPGCAVREAIANGELSRERWESYQKLLHEAKYADGREAYLREKKKVGKDIAKYRKHKQEEMADYRHEGCPESFTCKVCGAYVVPEGAGSRHRNHCPKCLSSLHVDNEPGDRASLCGGIMDPIGVWVRKNGEWAIIHRCRVCGVLSSNRIAADDNPALLMSIAVRPLAVPPFPLSHLEQQFDSR